MVQTHMKIYLASKSPRRKELLEQMEVPFEVLSVDTPEIVQPNETPEAYSRRITQEKLLAAWQKIVDDGVPPMPVLCNELIQINGDVSEALCRKITADLPEYFGLPECNEQYALGVQHTTNFAVQMHDEYIGLLSLNFPYPTNANIYWMAVLKKYHGKGYGKKLIKTATAFSKNARFKTMTLETLSPHASDENYLKTYRFYEQVGFTPLFDLKPEGYFWAMVYMCKSLNK